MTNAKKAGGEHQNVARNAQVLDILAQSGVHGLRQIDVSELTGLSSAVIHRLLAGLCAYGFVDFDPVAGRYHIGLNMLNWTAHAINRYGLAGYADGALDNLARRFGDTVYFSVISGDDAVCVDRREGAYPIKTLTLKVGDRRPLGIGAGSLAILAGQPAKHTERILAENGKARAQYPISDQQLRDFLARTGHNGLAVNAGHLIDGMSGVAVAICNNEGRALAAISVAAITSRLTGPRLEEVAAALKSEASRIETAAAGIINTPLARRISGVTETR